MTSTANAEPAIVPLADGEERLLLTIHRTDGNRNEFYLVRGEARGAAAAADDPVEFIAVVRATDDDPDDRSGPWVSQRGPDERTIYIRIAELVVNTPPPPGATAVVDGDVQWFVDRIREQHPGPSPMERVVTGTDLYVAACREVMSTANACLEQANRAVGIRARIEQHKNDGLPGTPIAIRNFTTYAEAAEREFVPLYEAFDRACAKAREAASELLAASAAFVIPVVRRWMIARRLTASCSCCTPGSPGATCLRSSATARA